MKYLCSILLLQSFSILLLGQSATNFSQKIDAYLQEMKTQKGLNGVVLVAQKGQPIYKKAFGLADESTKRPLNTDAPFYLGSIAKQFTTMGIMMLKEAGKLSYDDPLSTFFPDYPAYAKAITIRHLMTHTSGIKDQYNLGIYKKGLTNQDVYKTLTQQTLNFLPGEEWKYSNGGYVLLAMIIEKVSGQSLADFMEAHIFKPLAMDGAYVVHPTTKHAENRAIGFSSKAVGEDKAMFNDYEIYTTGAGGIYASVDDLLKWDQALYTQKLVSKATLKEAFKSAVLNNGTSTNYGFGWAIDEANGLVGHTGSLSGFRNFIDRDTINNITLIALTNNTATYRNDLRSGLQDLVLPKTPEQLAQAQLDAYNGHDLEAFLKPYAEDVKVYQFPDKLQYEGKTKMRETYQFLKNTPDLHCELLNRIIEGNTVIDHENVTVSKDRPPFKAVAIYKIRDGKIAEVYFIQ